MCAIQAGIRACIKLESRFGSSLNKASFKWESRLESGSNTEPESVMEGTYIVGPLIKSVQIYITGYVDRGSVDILALGDFTWKT